MYEWTESRIQEKFWNFIDKSGDCWLWVGPINNMGYGRVHYHDGGTAQRIFAHRFMLDIIEGRDIKGQVVMHVCDTPRCVNPKHLSLGSQADNIRDMARKNRMNQSGLEEGRTGEKRARGVQKASCKLTEKQVLEIRLRRSKGESASSLAEKYNVTKRNVYDIVNRKTWTHI